MLTNDRSNAGADSVFRIEFNIKGRTKQATGLRIGPPSLGMLHLELLLLIIEEY